MKQKLHRFFLSAFFYWLVASYAGYLTTIPEKIVTLAVCIPPVLGLMWGPLAAVGAYVGSLFIPAELNEFIFHEDGMGNPFMYFARGFWVFIAGYLPCFIWHKWKVESEKYPFALTGNTLQKFILIMFVTFAVTSVLRGLTATPAELEILSGWIGSGRSAAIPTYMLACFINDFCIAIFLSIAWFFTLVSKNYPFYHPKGIVPEETEELKNNTILSDAHRVRLMALMFYLFFPIGVIYISNFQLYGADDIKVWLHAISECLTVIDAYLVMMLYFFFRYRRSIMVEVVFLVSQTVFFTATVLSLGSSLALGELAESQTNESLHAMSVICRERLYRTFYCVRQAVNGMKIQALNALESYEQLAENEVYRKNYLDKMKKDLHAIAVGIDGSVSYYLRLIPEIEGTKGGFSMQREDARWEGALSPFIPREPVDLAPFSPDDALNVGWYYIPYRSKCATWIEPYHDPVTNFYVISYVTPLYVDGKFIGVLGMDIDFNFIIQEIRRMSIYDYGYVYILNRNNNVLYHREQPQGSVFKSNPEFQEMDIYLANGMWLGIEMPLSKVYDERNRILMHLISASIIVAMIISLLSIILASKAISPLSGMTDAAKRIASGDLNVKISYESGNELGILVRSIREMASKLEVYVYRDKLTGLRNAAAYISKANELDAQSKLVPDLAYGVVIFDANFLKKINDKYGHEAGNTMIRHAAKVICKVFAHSPVYRIGGDEFAAVLQGPDYDNREELLRLFDEKTAEEHFKAAEDTLTISVARGLGVYESDMDFATVAHKADVAMYEHKYEIKSKLGEEVR